MCSFINIFPSVFSTMRLDFDFGSQIFVKLNFTGSPRIQYSSCLLIIDSCSTIFFQELDENRLILAKDLGNITTDVIRRKVTFSRSCNEASSLLLIALTAFKMPSFFHHFPPFLIYRHVEEWTYQGKHVGISIPDLLGVFKVIP